MVKSGSLVQPREGATNQRSATTRQRLTFVRTPIAKNGLVALAAALNRLPTLPLYAPVKLRHGALTRVFPAVPELTGQQLLAIMEECLRHVFHDPWSKSPALLGRGRVGEPDRIVSLLHQALEFYLGQSAVARLKRCPECDQWFADLTRNRNKQRCGLGRRCSSSIYWSRTRRGAAGHTPSARQPAAKKDVAQRGGLGRTLMDQVKNLRKRQQNNLEICVICQKLHEGKAATCSKKCLSTLLSIKQKDRHRRHAQLIHSDKYETVTVED